ncbi:ABC transporter substrate-binding protein [Brevibacillus borstelensis]|uniref:ABC transporter substrate-binding protein n=1 Tax=Brevibacillus borstelensis TaxID=45462 RepID=UPI0030BFE931
MMFRFQRAWYKITALIVTVLLIAGCTTASQQTTGEQLSTDAGSTSQGKEGGTLVISALIEPDTIDVQSATWVDNANLQVYDPLLHYDLNGKVIPGVAEKYEVSADGKVWTFILRGDVTFQSGEPLTAEAAKKTIERFAKISPVKDLAGPLEKVEAPDPHTLKVYFSEAFAPFMTMAAGSFIGPIDPKRVDELGEKFGENPSATGPFLFVKCLSQVWDALTISRLPRFPILRFPAIHQLPVAIGRKTSFHLKWSSTDRVFSRCRLVPASGMTWIRIG